MAINRLATVWLTLILPVSALMIQGGPFHGLLPHFGFHPIAILVLLAVIVLTFRLRAATWHRGVRVLTLLVVGSGAVSIVGQIGEEVVVGLHGGIHAVDDAALEADHQPWSVAGLGGLNLMLILLSVLSIVAGVALLRGRDRRGWAVLLPGMLYFADFFVIVIADGPWIPVSRWQTLTVIGALVLGATALQTRRVRSVLDAAAYADPAQSSARRASVA